MAFTYPPTVSDPRIAYNPRLVDGLTAYWQANPGRNVDYQTGLPLADRLAMARGGQTQMGGDQIYGDSYGGVQSAEQAQQSAYAAQALAAQKMQLDAQIRQDAINQRAQQQQDQRDYNMQRLLESARQADNRGLGSANALDFKYAAEAGKGDRSALNRQNQMDLLKTRLDARNAVNVNDLKDFGKSAASEIGSSVDRINQLQGEVSSFEALKEQQGPMLAYQLDKGHINKTDIGLFSPSNPLYADSAERANKLVEAGKKARESAKLLNQELNNLAKIQRDVNANGFTGNLQSGYLAHPAVGRFPIMGPDSALGAPLVPSRASDAPVTPQRSPTGALGAKYRQTPQGY